MKRRNVCIPDVLWAQLKQVGEEKGISVSDVLRRAAEFYLESHDNETPDRKKVRALDSHG
jgi:metal-responsive CopG/Arc/MetJ family transcriptional regulator